MASSSQQLPVDVTFVFIDFTLSRLTLAVQKKGRLSEKTLKLLEDCGIIIQNGKIAKLQAKAENFPLQVLYLRDDDIPECVADGIADIGIVGENVFLEKARKVSIIKRLGFSKISWVNSS